MPPSRLLFGILVKAADGGVSLTRSMIHFIIVVAGHELVKPVLEPLIAILAGLGPTAIVAICTGAVIISERSARS